MDSPLFSSGAFPTWNDLIAAVERPETVPARAAEGGAWSDFLRELTGHGLFPMAYAAWRSAGVLQALPVAARGEAERRMNLYRAGTAAAWEEIGRTLDRLLEGGFRPILLKGADLALRYYPEPHLRPLSDLDLLFESPAEAERAFALLEGAGYRREKEGIAIAPWALSQHLPVLLSPHAAFPVELHGALVHSPRDRRWIEGASCLLEGLRGFPWQGRPLRGLAPEALVVHLCGHMWLQHASAPPKATVLFDFRAVLEGEGEAFSWERLVGLARRAGMAGAAARGLSLLEEHLSVKVPPDAVEALAEAERGERVLRLPAEAADTENLLQRLRHGNLRDGVVSALRIAFPPAAFMRERYPERRGWPLWALYPGRWADQAGRLARWLRARAWGR